MRPAECRLRRPDRQGSITRADFDPTRGAAWTIDLTNVYDGVREVSRSVVHLLPRIAVVLDDARLQQSQPISLRWHVAGATEPKAGGAFRVRAGQATLAARMVRLDGAATIRSGRHRHEPPYNRDSLGAELTQRNDHYVELETAADRCRVLSLFCILGSDGADADWRDTSEGWKIRAPEGEVLVRMKDDTLIVSGPVGAAWSLPIGSATR